MSLVKSKNTKPETELKSIFRKLGYRYRYANWNKLPGKLDLVYVARKKAVFLHGCFWHCHEGCHNNRIPKSNVVFWITKLNKNVEHDKEVYYELEQLGWRYLIIWECELKKSSRVALDEKIVAFMES